MKKIKIEEQENVLNVYGCNSIVSASAGSGKTSVLVDKILNYIKEKNVSIKNILALTFTNLAAGEMKNRLLNSLSNLIKNENRFDLIDEIDLIPQADISTFHSFYEKLIKKYFYVLGIKPSFNILSDEQLNQIKENSFNQAIDDLKNINYKKYFKLTEIFGKKRNDNSIKEKIFKLDNFLESQLNSDKWLHDKAFKMYINKEESINYFFNDILCETNNTINNLNIILIKAKQSDEDALCCHINKCVDYLSDILKMNNEEKYNFIIEKFSFPKLYKNKNISETENFISVKHEKEKYMQIIKKYKEKNYGTFEQIIKSFELCRNNISIIIELYKNYKNILNNKKLEINSFDYSDLEKYCFELLKKEEIKNVVKNNYKYIFVDEFQDINPLQFEILKLIENKNVMYVGDAKQSIYSFRQSDVDIIIQTFQKFNENYETKALNLNCNFRSNKKILNFDNLIFDILMTKESCGIDYKSNSRFNGLSENDCDGNSVEIFVIKEEKLEEEKKPLEVYKITNDISSINEIDLEAEAITIEIIKMLNQNIFINGQNRIINYKDIAILTRNRSEFLNNLVDQFNKYNLPYFINEEKDLLSVKEVQILLSLLKLCINQKDDINLIKVLPTIFCKLNYDEIALIKINSQGNYFYEKCFYYINNFDNFISKKLKNFFINLNQLRKNIQLFGVSKSLRDFIKKFYFIENVLKLYDGKEREKTINQFIDYIEKSGMDFQLFEFLNYINSIKSIKVSQNIQACENAITITTIHASKGLEFPVVILADCGRDFLKTKLDSSDIKINKKLGIAIKNYDEENKIVSDSIFEKIINDEQKKSDIAENLRLLYVALSRAKNKLLIFGKINNEIEKINYKNNLMFVKSNYLNYILGALENYKKLDGVKINIINKNDYKIYNDEKKLIKYNDQIINISKFLQRKIIKKDNIILKKSVTDLIQNLNNFEENKQKKIKNITKFKYEYDNLNQGIILHKVLENINFFSKNLEADLVKIINKISDDQINNKKYFNISLKNINLLKTIIFENNKLYKEKEFMIFNNLKNIFDLNDENNILIQGKIDLLVLGKKNILIDYKYTSLKENNKIIDKYKNQLKIYKKAFEYATNKKIDEIYILNLKENNLIKL